MFGKLGVDKGYRRGVKRRRGKEIRLQVQVCPKKEQEARTRGREERLEEGEDLRQERGKIRMVY